jgi:hypothetical protein
MMRRLVSFGLVSGLICIAFAALALEGSATPEGPSVYIISPIDGAVVSSPVTVKFGLRGMGVAPAGVEVAGTGHHHLLIDLEELPAMDKPLPASAQVKHFGKGQTETRLELTPGEHSLQLLMGNYMHVPHQAPVLSEKITITVR